MSLWRIAIIVATASVIPVMLLKDRYPWVIAVPIVLGTCWVVWEDLKHMT